MTIVEITGGMLRAARITLRQGIRVVHETGQLNTGRLRSRLNV
jgi:hypothetical protein